MTNNLLLTTKLIITNGNEIHELLILRINISGSNRSQAKKHVLNMLPNNIQKILMCIKYFIKSYEMKKTGGQSD